MQLNLRVRPPHPFVMALALLFTAWFLEMSFVDMLGFPDGATTDYDVAQSRTVWAFDRFTVAVALWLIGLSFWSRRRDATRAFIATIAVYAVAVVLVLVLDRYFAATLPGPWGG